MALTKDTPSFMDQIPKGLDPLKFQLAVPDKPAQCAWYKPCSYGSWEDLQQRETNGGRPVVVQEKRCSICNRAVRRIAYPSSV